MIASRRTVMALRLLLLVCLSALLTTGAEAQNQLQFFATLVDSSGAPGTAVQPGNIQVTENGVESRIVKIEPVNWPLKVQLLVDNGVGLGRENLVFLRNGVRGFLEALAQGTEVTFVTTSPQPRFLVRATTDREALLQGLGRLAPDSGSGRFVESLNEATQRIERDTTDSFPVIVSVATTSADANARESMIQQLMGRLVKRPTTVHVVLLATGAGKTSRDGYIQNELGLNVTKFTGGRFENIAAGARLETLLPEIGALVAKSNPGGASKFRITVERPGGASGDLGKISVILSGGFVVTDLSLSPR
jgi:hypothetical protein